MTITESRSGNIWHYLNLGASYCQIKSDNVTYVHLWSPTGGKYFLNRALFAAGQSLRWRHEALPTAPCMPCVPPSLTRAGKSQRDFLYPKQEQRQNTPVPLELRGHGNPSGRWRSNASQPEIKYASNAGASQDGKGDGYIGTAKNSE